MVNILNILDNVEFMDDEHKRKKTVLRINMANSICMCLKELRARTNNMIDSRHYFEPEQQLLLLHETW